MFEVNRYDSCCGRLLCEQCGGLNDCTNQDTTPCPVIHVCDDCTNAGDPLMICESDEPCEMDGTVYAFCETHAHQDCPECPKLCFVCAQDYVCPHENNSSADDDDDDDGGVYVGRSVAGTFSFIDSQGCARRYIETS